MTHIANARGKENKTPAYLHGMRFIKWVNVQTSAMKITEIPIVTIETDYIDEDIMIIIIMMIMIIIMIRDML